MQEFVTQDAVCRVCKIPIQLSIAPDYAEFGDSMNLLPLATCNRCYDYKISRDTLESSMMRMCLVVFTARQTLSDGPKLSTIVQNIRRALLDKTRAYAKIVAAHHRYPTLLWSEDFADILMEKPAMAFKAFGQYRIQARENAKNQHRALQARWGELKKEI